MSEINTPHPSLLPTTLNPNPFPGFLESSTSISSNSCSTCLGSMTKVTCLRKNHEGGNNTEDHEFYKVLIDYIALKLYAGPRTFSFASVIILVASLLVISLKAIPLIDSILSPGFRRPSFPAAPS